MKVNMQPCDIRLLIVFDAIMRERSVSRAAQTLGLSQAATSNSLNRLRASLADQLFFRTVTGMAPTPKAIELSAPIREGLEKIQGALNYKSFKPEKPEGVFTLAFSDQAVQVVLPSLLGRLKGRAPGIRLNIETKWNSTVQDHLDTATVDLAIGIIPNLPKRFGRAVLFEDNYVAVMRKDHPLSVMSEIDADIFSSAKHLAVRPSIDRSSQIELTLRELGYRRDVAMNVNQFIAVPSILNETDLIACMLKSVAEQLDQKNVTCLPINFIHMPVEITIAGSAVRASNPGNRWLRLEVIASCEHLRDRGRG